MTVKKIFAGLLAAVTCASVLPFTAFAADTGGGGVEVLAEAASDVAISTYNYTISDRNNWNTITSGSSNITLGNAAAEYEDVYYLYYLEDDASLSNTVTIEANTICVLDLNGKTLTLTGSPLEVTSNATLYIIDSSTEVTGSLTCTANGKKGNYDGNDLVGPDASGGNSHAYYAGAIDNEGELHLKGVTITGTITQTSNDYSYEAAGGAIYNNGLLYIDGSTITGSTSVTITGSHSARSFGGAIYNLGTVSISKSTITGTISSSSGEESLSCGGAIYNAASSESVTVTDSTFTGCSAIATSNSSSNNNAGAFGGAIYNADADGTVEISGTTITKCSVQDNYSADGGAIYNKAGTTTVSGGCITGNTANFSGGGIYIAGGTVKLTDHLLIYGNTATTNGNDIRIASSGGGTLSLDKSVNNYSTTKHLYTNSTESSINGFNEGGLEFIGWYQDTSTSKYSSNGKSSATLYNSWSNNTQTFTGETAIIAAYGPVITYVYTTDDGIEGNFTTAPVTSKPIDILYTSHSETLMSAGEYTATSASNFTTYYINNSTATIGSISSSLMPTRYCSIAGWATNAYSSNGTSGVNGAWIAADSSNYGTKYDCGANTSTTFSTNTTLYAVYNPHVTQRLVSALDATCSTNGHTAIYFCETCGAYFDDGVDNEGDTHRCETKIGQSSSTYTGTIDRNTATLYACGRLGE